MWTARGMDPARVMSLALFVRFVTISLVRTSNPQLTTTPSEQTTTSRIATTTSTTTDNNNNNSNNNNPNRSNIGNGTNVIDDNDNDGVVQSEAPDQDTVVQADGATTVTPPPPPPPPPPLSKCRYQFQQNVMNSLYTVHQQIVEVLSLRFTVGVSQARCYLTRQDLESKLNSSQQSQVVAIFLFGCLRPGGTDVVFVENEEAARVYSEASRSELNGTGDSEANVDGKAGSGSFTFYDNYISYFQTSFCRVNIKGVEMVANMTELRVLSVHGDRAWDLSELQTHPELCKAFSNVVALAIISDWSAPGYLHHLARCAGSLDNVVEMVLTNDSLTSFPEVLHAVVPNLRALDGNNNKLKSPVEFPWPQGFATLPGNLSRTYHFNVLYNFGGSFHMEPNLFRRVFLLDGNKITNLTHFQFHSEFQYISLEGNGLREIADDVFDAVVDLQFISLAHNSLETLPENLFARLASLKRLDLQGNKLKSLPTSIFRNLRKLESLNVAENKLVVLQDSLFSSLEGLKKLKLNNNSIVSVSDGAFTTLSVKLKSLELQHNPLKTFPVILLLLRGLVSTNLEFTHIEALDFVDIDRRVSVYSLTHALKNPTKGEFVDLEESPSFQKVVSLKHSRLRSVVMYNATRETVAKFMLIVKYFNILTGGSCLACDCNILNVTHHLRELLAEGKLTGQEACLAGWTCVWPTELSGKPVARLLDEETYCPLRGESVEGGSGNTLCPEGCACYVRTGVRTVIVDCEHGGLTSLPRRVPDNTRELWLQNNTINTVDKLPYLQKLHSLKLTANNVQELPMDVLLYMPELRLLHMDDNWLTSLTSEFRSLEQLRELRLAGNPFRCDCHTLWMKDWLLTHQTVARDWLDIKCSTEGNDGQMFTSVANDQFVCKVYASLGDLAAPIATPLTFAFILLTLAVVTFIQRRRLKVLLYIHTGLHPFDRDAPDDGALYDVAVFCDVAARTWVLKKVVEHLEAEGGYRVFFYSRDAFVGFTVTENVRHCTKNSRRLVAVLSENWQQEDLMLTVTREALARSRKDMVHFMTVVVHGFSAKDIRDKDIRQYIRGGLYIHTDDKHFAKKLVYEMPHVRKVKDRHRNRRGKENGVDDPRPVVLHDIVAAAENRQNVILEQRVAQLDSYLCDARPLSEREVDLNVNVKHSGGDPDYNTQRHVSIGYEDRYGDRNATNEPVCNVEMTDNQYRNVELLQQGRTTEEGSRIGNPDCKVVIQNQMSVDSKACEQLKSVFVWYADKDLPFTLKNIVEPLELLGHGCVIQDRNFLLGAAIQQNIVQAAETCSRAILVLSDQTVGDEWFIFVFHVAFDRQLQSRDHRVALVTREGVVVTRFVEEIQQVLRTFAVLPENDPWFRKRLRKFVHFDDYEIC